VLVRFLQLPDVPSDGQAPALTLRSQRMAFVRRHLEFKLSHAADSPLSAQYALCLQQLDGL